MNYSQSRQLVIDRVVCVLRIVTILLLAATLLLGRQNKLLAVADIMLSVTILTIWVCQPQYIHERKKGLFDWNDYYANETDMLLCAMMPPLVLGIRTCRDFLIQDWTLLISVAFAASVVLGVALLLVSKAEEYKMWVYACIFLMLFLCMIGICAQLNFALDLSEPEMQRCLVVAHEEKESSGIHRGPTRYYCIVETEDQEQIEIPVSKEQYQNIRKSASVQVYFGKGAFGVAYAYIPVTQYSFAKN